MIKLILVLYFIVACAVDLIHFGMCLGDGDPDDEADFFMILAAIHAFFVSIVSVFL